MGVLTGSKDDRDIDHQHGEDAYEQGTAHRMSVKLRHEVAARVDDVSRLRYPNAKVLRVPRAVSRLSLHPTDLHGFRR